MKKTIILFLFILPVAIVLLVFAVVGFVARAAMYVEIEKVYVSSEHMRGFTDEGYEMWGESENYDRWFIRAQIGDVFEFEKFITVEPAKVGFERLEINCSNPSAVELIDGKIHIQENMRFSDVLFTDNKLIEFKLSYSNKDFMIIYIDIREDLSRFDYFAFDTDVFKKNISDSQPLWSDYIQIRESASENTVTKYLEIDAAKASSVIALSEILLDGIDTAPKSLLYSSSPAYEEFLNSLSISSSNSSVLRIEQGYEAGQFNAALLTNGEIELTITTDFNGVSGEPFTIKLTIAVVGL